MSKRFFFLFTAALPGMALAQTAAPSPSPSPAAPLTPKQEEVQSFAVQQPDEGSPFFAVRETAKLSVDSQGLPQLAEDTQATYPKVKGAQTTATAMFTHFFTDMFSSIKWKGKGDNTTEMLTVAPEDFSVDKRRELDTVYTIENNTGKMMRFNYSTTQRVDVVTLDPQGNVMNKMSDDRSITPQDGLVILNPHERLEYQQTVPTRDMKAGQTYNVRAEMVGYPEFTTTKAVTPSP